MEVKLISKSNVEKNSRTSVKEILFWTMYASIALSGWSYYFLVDVIGLPFYLYEVFFIIPIIVYRSMLIRMFSRIRRAYVLAFLLLMGFLIVGCCINSEHIMAQITTYRTLFYVWAFVYIFSGIKSFNLVLLQALCVGSCIGQFLFTLVVNSESDQTAVNIVAMAMMIIIPVIKNNIKEVIVYTVFGFVIAFRSSFRINIVVVIVALVIALLYMSIVKRKSKAIIITCFMVIVFIGVVQNFDYVTELLIKVFHIENSMSIYRITYRLEQFFKLDFEASQDTIRFELFSKIFTEFDNYIIPTGLIGKDIGQYGLYKDAPVMFFYSAFGSIGTVLIIGYVLIRGLRYSWKSFRFKNIQMAVFSIMLPIFLLLFMLNGTFIMATYEACLTGMILGYWYNKNEVELK